MAASYAETVEEARAGTRIAVLVERQGAHAVVTLNDPEKLNPLSAAHGPTARAPRSSRPTSRCGQSS